MPWMGKFFTGDERPDRWLLCEERSGMEPALEAILVGRGVSSSIVAISPALRFPGVSGVILLVTDARMNGFVSSAELAVDPTGDGR